MILIKWMITIWFLVVKLLNIHNQSKMEQGHDDSGLCNILFNQHLGRRSCAYWSFQLITRLKNLNYHLQPKKQTTKSLLLLILSQLGNNKYIKKIFSPILHNISCVCTLESKSWRALEGTESIFRGLTHSIKSKKQLLNNINIDIEYI